MQDFNGKVALITGAASGIGYAIAEVLGESGAALSLVDIEAGALAKVEHEFLARGWSVLSQTADVSSFDAVHAAVKSTVHRFGRIDIICNNAGVGLEGPVESWTDAGWSWVLGVNLMGVVNGVRAATPFFKAQNSGHILNVASIGGLTAAANHGQYGASKFAVVGLSQSLRDELAPHGVGVTVLCPGFVKSRIATSARNAPGDLPARQAWLMETGFTGPAKELFQMIERRVDTGLDARAVGEMALRGLRTNAFIVLTEREFLPDIERRQKAVAKAIAVLGQWPTQPQAQAQTHG
ncbi:SDR family oxidoreductase [Phenylobacterium montanum]|uniref:D-xylose 1-dehydrogenase n=1 Tax=Phenylobacterium montanum TaxID=2823693 RepID=A0A975IXM5_9CAUL|nr:SDR family NAD(P)-dependent oxidoreductase [Caulobacter sp. S6]QUD89566.1 SDR family NAD(P)-dependent oxidoreductase [Caulobacter sp. S6]